LKWWPNYGQALEGQVSAAEASYLRKELVALDPVKQTTAGSGGFVCKQQITRRKKGSQEDPFDLSTGSDAQWNETHVKGFWS